MLNAPELTDLRAANPVSLDEARSLADALQLHSRVLSAANEPFAARAARPPGRLQPRSQRWRAADAPSPPLCRLATFGPRPIVRHLFLF